MPSDELAGVLGVGPYHHSRCSLQDALPLSFACHDMCRPLCGAVAITHAMDHWPPALACLDSWTAAHWQLMYSESQAGTL